MNKISNFQFLIFNEIQNPKFKIIILIIFIIFFIFPKNVQAISVTEKQATVYCQNDPNVSLEIPADTFKKPADVKLRKMSETEVRPPNVNMDINKLSNIYELEVYDEQTGEPINYFPKELKLKIPVETESLENLNLFFWDRKAQTWIATDGEVLDNEKNIILGKVNYTGYYAVSKKTFDGREIDYFKFAAIIFITAGLLIIVGMWYNKKRKT